MLILNTLTDGRLQELIKSGHVGVIPTDTVYGLACRADLPDAVARLYALKSRDHKPGTVIAADIEQLMDLGIRRRYLRAVEHYWPNPMSIILPDPELLAYLDQGLKSLAMRIPSDKGLRGLLKVTGPLVTSSANMPGEPTSNTLQEAVNYFGDTVDFYVDGGDLSGRQSSTLIKMVDDTVEVLREGAVKLDANGCIVTGDS